MRVTQKRTEEEIRKELFGPLNEAATSSYEIGVSSATWCELSEMRLMQLIIEFKPAGVNRHFHFAALHDHMAHVYDSEVAQCEIFLSDEDKPRFRQQQLLLSSSIPMEVQKRIAFSPKYICRPTIPDIKKKIDELYDMKTVEKNEGFPDKFDVHSDFFLPDGQFSELINRKEERSGSVVSNASKKRRVSPDE